VSEEQLGKRQIYPNITELRQVSSKVSRGGGRGEGRGGTASRWQKETEMV
jgi:hypothetical protein